LSDPSPFDFVRAALRRVPPRRALLLAAALAALALAARHLLAPGEGLLRPLLWGAAGVVLGELARRAGKPGSRGREVPAAASTAAAPSEPPERGARLVTAALLLLVLAGVVFRVSWVRWDDGQLLHPDEYGLTGTLTKLSFPKSAAEWFDTARSPMSPYARYDLDGRAIPDGAPDAAMRWGQWPQLIVRGAAEALSADRERGGPDFTRFAELRLLGRRLSALASVATLGLLFLLARRVAGRGIALLATALAALAPLALQQARFLTVDGFAALFATAALLPAVRIAAPGERAERPPWGDAALFALLAAMSVASRLNLAPIVLLLPAALLVRGRGEKLLRLLRRAAGPALLGAVVFLATFRVAHPMSFRAPRGETTVWTATLNPDWLRNVELARSESALETSAPPAEQWTGRTRVLFPARNTFLWGLGLPGGPLALAGLVLVGVALRSERRRPPGALLLLAAWTAGFFLFMAVRLVSSIRYFLPIYPLFALFGALALSRLAPSGAGAARRATAGGLLLLGLAWAWGYSGAWRAPNTRIAASRAIYAEFPAATNLLLDEGSGPRRVPLRTERSSVLAAAPRVVGLPAGTQGELRGVTFAHASGEAGSPLRVVVRETAGGPELASGTHLLPDEPRHPLGEAASVPLGPVRLSPERSYEIALSAPEGPVTLSSSVLLGETWDEVLPCAVDGLDGGLYDVRLLPVRGPDHAGKREAILEALAEADGVVLSSPRALWVAPRLPSNHPFTLAWYRALFDGSLGFAPLPSSPFQAPLVLGPLRLSDAAGTAAWGRPPELPPGGGTALAAEEAFWVYDRAPVWLFARSASRSISELEARLPASLLDDVVAQTPLQASAAPGGLALSPERLAREDAGVGRDAPPDPRAPANRRPARAVLAWSLLLVLLAAAALPFTLAAFGRHPALAFATARLVGLLAVGWFAFVLAALRVVPFGRSSLLLALAVLVAGGAAVAWKRRAPLVEALRPERRTLLATEGIFQLLFALGLFLRWGNPDLWHPSLGGEKPMALAFLNALLRTSELPAQHPWFAGGTLNYYDFGYLLAAVPARLLGLVPELAYNLAVPTFFALAGAGAFALGASLVRSAAARGEERPAGAPLLAGLLSTALLVLLGNLGQLRLLLRALAALGGQAAGTVDPIAVATGAMRAFAGAPLPIRGEEWYWNATRVVPAVAGSGNEITEFPFFTYLFGDLHAHALALPIGLLLLAFALSLADSPPSTRLGRGALFGVGALALGALRATNPWDVPLLTLLAVAAGAYGGACRAEPGRRLRAALGWGIGPLALSALLFRPFDAAYVAPYTNVVRNAGAATPLAAWLWLWGLQAFLLASLAALELVRRRAAFGEGAERRAPLAVSGLLLGALALGLVSGVPSAPVVLPLAAAAAALALAPGGGAAPERRAVLLLAAGAFLVTLGVDVLSVGGDRMNTVFKLSFQAWALLAVASGPTLAWVVAALRDGERTRPGPWPATAALLLGAAALYPLTATPARFAERFPRVAPGETCRAFADAPAPPGALGAGAAGRPRGLDGAAFLADSALCVEGRLVPLRYDGDGFAWLRANERGSPAILEAVLPEYRWGSRFSVHTGLPAVVGWSWHVRQHRAAVPGSVVEKRIAEVDAFYRSRLAAPGEAAGEGRMTVEELRRFLARQRVRWVVDGLLERAVYGEEGLVKLGELERLGLLERAYANPGLTLWRVLPDARAR
jgi:YYY domain-containing protein